MLLAILVFRPKIAQIMFDSKNNATLVPENASFIFQAKCTNSGNLCVYPQLNKVKSAYLFVYKTPDTAKTCPMINS